MKVGVGKANLEFKDDLVLFGYGPKGGRGYNGKGEEKDTLQVRALWIESDKEKLLLLSYDMVSGSQVVEELLLEALKLEKHQLLMVGTHTHSAPGRYFGNIYDLAQWPAGLDMTVVKELVDKGVLATQGALETARDATVSVAQRVLWQAGRNRSYAPFLSNFERGVAGWPEELWNDLGIEMPTGLPVEEQAVDPRMTVLTFRDEKGKAFASWASWCCHPATSRPGERRPYHRDWPGMAVDGVENQAGLELAIIHQRANGDVTSLPVGAAEQADPLGRMKEIAEKVVEAWAGAVAQPAEPSKLFKCRRWDLDPTAEAPGVYNGDLPSWEMGASVTGGSEEVPAGLYTQWFGEAHVLPWRTGAQAKKFPDPTTLLAKTWLARAVLKNPRFRLSPSARHPFWFLQFGTHLVFASPFEQTTYAARTAERVLLDALELAGAGNVTVSPLGLASDYAGYLTTPKEFALQHYEGGHTLYGKRQLDVCIDIWMYLLQQAHIEGA